MTSPVIDVHTHCLTEAWFALLKDHGAPRYSVKEVRGGLRAIHLDDAPFMTPVPAMFDYALRLKTMDAHGVDICIVSLTCPNCYWGGPEISLRAAQIMNDDMPYLLLYVPKTIYAVSARLQGFRPDGDFTHAYWNAADWSISQ